MYVIYNYYRIYYIIINSIKYNIYIVILNIIYIYLVILTSMINIDELTDSKIQYIMK